MSERHPNPFKSRDREPGGDVGFSGAIIGIGAGALSGFIVGFLARGDLAGGATIVFAVLFSAYAGWWARGLR